MKLNAKHCLVLIFLPPFLSGQVGIGTDSPRPETKLDVNGPVNVVERIYLGDSDLNAEGDPGEQNQLIISGGETGNPAWDEILMPKGFGEGFSMGDMKTVADETGVLLTAGGTTTPPYQENSLITYDEFWLPLEGLTTTFNVYKPNNKVNFMFQSVIQRNGGTISSYGCGLFLNSPEEPAVFRLKGTRTGALTGASGSFQIFNMNVTLQNLTSSPEGTEYTAKIACRGRTFVGAPTAVGMGRAVASGLNNKMAQSSLNIYVLESN